LVLSPKQNQSGGLLLFVPCLAPPPPPPHNPVARPSFNLACPALISLHSLFMCGLIITLMMEAVSTCETLVETMQCNIVEDGYLYDFIYSVFHLIMHGSFEICRMPVYVQLPVCPSDVKPFCKFCMGDPSLNFVILTGKTVVSHGRINKLFCLSYRIYILYSEQSQVCLPSLHAS
jgi:hypothetical protein